MGISKVVPAVLALGSMALAQTYTSCDPTKTTCPVNAGFTQSVYTFDFKGEDAENWKSVGTGQITYGGPDGAAFVMEKPGDAPTLDSTKYIFFGSVSVVCRAAGGTGVVSSVVLQSDTLDEIDWEWTGGDGYHVQTNYFGKGNTTAYDRGLNPALAQPQERFYNYTIDWTAERVQWLIDGSVVRTLRYADALGGRNYPQTPMVVKIGNWAGGDPGNSPGTIEWAGGLTDFSKAPFTMYVRSVTIRNANPAAGYEYTDRSGSYQSIKLSDKMAETKPATPIDPDSLTVPEKAVVPVPVTPASPASQPGAPDTPGTVMPPAAASGYEAVDVPPLPPTAPGTKTPSTPNTPSMPTHTMPPTSTPTTRGNTTDRFPPVPAGASTLSAGFSITALVGFLAALSL